MKRMLRHEIPVDDKEHQYLISGKVRKVATRQWIPGTLPVVEFWAENIPSEPGGKPLQRTFLVVGTGHFVPDEAQWRGTTDRDESGLVWHLYELTPGATDD